MTAKILLICGSLNQTTMMHKISRHLPDYQCFFTPFYSDGWKNLAAKAGLLGFSILGGRHRRATMEYLEREKLHIDVGGSRNNYDAVITCSDLIIQNNIRGKRLILVQEGMTEEEDFLFFLVRNFKFPRYLANTAAAGLSDAYDVFCVASHGYRNLFIRKGVKPEKMIVTGIPNYDNAARYLKNDFPHRHYVLVATSSIRETLKMDDRAGFLRRVKEMTGGRKVIFKLHPNEDAPRATREIREFFPDELILTSGNTHEMIANCDTLIAQTSSVIYTGLALGKEVHSYLDPGVLKQLLPMQNGGRSAGNIAEICRQLVNTPQAELKLQGVKEKPFTRGLKTLEAI